MKVKKLIAMLGEANQEAEVVIFDSYYETSPITGMIYNKDGVELTTDT